MKELFLKLLKDYQYDSPGELFCSLFPSFRYNLPIAVTTVSFFSSLAQVFFGLSFPAVVGFGVIMIVELLSGIIASRTRKEQFDSGRLKRFGFRFGLYFVLISVPYLFESSLRERGSDLAAGAFQWIQVFLIVQIVFENTISILENIAVIDGKDKSAIVNKIKAKLESLF